MAWASFFDCETHASMNVCAQLNEVSTEDSAFWRSGALIAEWFGFGRKPERILLVTGELRVFELKGGIDFLA